MSFNEIFDILLNYKIELPYEIVWKILITHRGYQHPTTILLQPHLKIFHENIHQIDLQTEYKMKMISCNTYETDGEREREIQDYMKGVEREKFVFYKHFELLFSQRRGFNFYLNWGVKNHHTPMMRDDHNQTKTENMWLKRDNDIQNLIRNYRTITCKELKKLLKMNGIKGYSKLNRQQLIQLYLTF